MTKWALGFAVLGWSFVPMLAHAEEPRAQGRVSLRADTPDDCADAVELVHRIEALLGRSLETPVTEPLAVRLSVLGNAASGYAAELRFTSAQGDQRRTLEHPSCTKLIEASALVIALAIDPEAVQATERAREAGTEPVPAVVVAPARMPEPPPLAAAARTPEPLPALRGARLGLAAVLGAGPLPDLGAGLQASLGFRRAAWRAEVVGRYWATRSQTLSVAPNAGAELDLFTMGVRGCWLPAQGAWSVAACAGADLGEMRGTGVRLDDVRTSRARYTDLAASASVAYTHWRVAPELGFEFSRALEQPRFGVSVNGEPRETYRPAAWGLLAFLGLAFEL